VLLQVGAIVKAHGLRGEVVVELVSNRPERLQEGSVLRSGERELKVLRSSGFGSGGRGPHRGRWIVSFDGVTDRTSAEGLRGAVLEAEALEVPDALWVHELVGKTVSDVEGTSIGRVESVEANPASDLLVLDTGDLVPLCFVVETGADRIVVDLPDGLIARGT
jgi:16S rRNA processing protein RimM